MILELTNFEMPAEYCTVETNTGKLNYYRGDKKEPGFTGMYFRNDSNFLGIFPTKNGPRIYVNGMEYDVKPSLDITLEKNGKNRKFCIKDYNVEIDYLESQYIGFDIWSDEKDVDLLFMIEQNYKDKSFYDKFTI